MLRFAADRRTLAFVATYYVVAAVAYLWNPASWAVALPLMALVCVLSFFCAVITHNTIHAPIFHNRWLNKVFQVALTLAYGHPVSAYVPGHNLSHHVHTQTRKDVMRTTKARFRWNLLNQLFFLPIVAKDIARADSSYAMAMYKERPRWFRQWLLEWAMLIGVSAVLLYNSPWAFLLYIFIPHNYAAWGIVGMNFVQHDGCDPDHPYNHSRNVVGPVINFFTFNNGFHGIHHVHPGLHWSLTPEAHAKEIAPFIHPALDQPSMIAYCWRAYVWPGKRLNYDGTPVVLGPEGPDEDWIPSVGETPDGVSTGAEA